MFGLGMPEILLILAIALIVIGPKKLPELAKTLGRAMGEFKRSAQDFKRSIDIDTTLNDIKDIDSPGGELKQAVAEANKKADAPVPDDNISGTPDTDRKKTDPRTNDGGRDTAYPGGDHGKNTSSGPNG